MTQFHKSRGYDRKIHGTNEIREIDPYPDVVRDGGKSDVAAMVAKRADKVQPGNRRARRSAAHVVRKDAERNVEYVVYVRYQHLPETIKFPFVSYYGNHRNARTFAYHAGNCPDVVSVSIRKVGYLGKTRKTMAK